MKKFRYLYIVVFMLLHSGVVAQTYFGVKYGAGAGLPMAKVSRLVDLETAVAPGYSAGLVFIYMGHPHMGIRAEVDYTQKIWEEAKDTSAGFNFRRVNNYIEVPFLSHFRIGKKFQVTIDAGSQLSFTGNTTEEIGNELDTLPNGAFYDYNDSPTVLFCAVGGIGVSYGFKFGTLQLEARYCHTLTDMMKVLDYENISFLQYQFVTLSAVYLIDFKKKEKEDVLK